jgi:hypothetical protein
MTRRLGQHVLRPSPVADVARPLAGRVVFVIAQMLGQLLLKAGSSTVFVSCLGSPPGPVSDTPCSRPWRTSSLAASDSGLNGGLFRGSRQAVSRSRLLQPASGTSYQAWRATCASMRAFT